MQILCPICGGVLAREPGAWRCEKGHSFDVARQGYVNLLPVQNKHSLHPGDTKEQVLARRTFLDSGCYRPILDAVCQVALRHRCAGPILDVGCGEGYYSSHLAGKLGADLLGLDISKEAVRCAAGRHKNATWLCATAAHLPVPDGSVGLLTSLFALTLPEEFARVLCSEGFYLQVLACEDHLLGLKSIIYDELTHREKDTVPTLPGFTLLESVPVRFPFTVEDPQVQNLLAMTPHYYRISKEGARRLSQTQSLTDTASCVINLYRKN